MSSVRHVQVGGRWEPPPPAGGLDPDDGAGGSSGCASSLEGWRDVLLRLAEAAVPERPLTLQQAVVRGFRGVSPQLARDLASAAGVAVHARPADLEPAQWQRLYAQWQAWLQRLASGDFASSWCEERGEYSVLGQLPQAMATSLLRFLHTYYTAPQQVRAMSRRQLVPPLQADRRLPPAVPALLQAEQFSSLKQQLSKAVTSAIVRLQVREGGGVAAVLTGSVGAPVGAGCVCVGSAGAIGRRHPSSPCGLPASPPAPVVLAPSIACRPPPPHPPPTLPTCPRVQRKAESLQRQGGEGDKHEGTQRRADMVLANVHRTPPGAASVLVEDWDTGELVTLQLDPQLSAVANAEALYKQVGACRVQRRTCTPPVLPVLLASRLAGVTAPLLCPPCRSCLPPCRPESSGAPRSRSPRCWRACGARWSGWLRWS